MPYAAPLSPALQKRREQIRNGTYLVDVAAMAEILLEQIDVAEPWDPPRPQRLPRQRN